MNLTQKHPLTSTASTTMEKAEGIDEQTQRTVSTDDESLDTNNSMQQHHLSDEEFFQRHYILAQRGDDVSQFEVGYCYCEGRGIEVNKVNAAFWFECSADQGYPPAQCLLGCCYDFGYGVPKDQATAVQYYRLAATAGHDVAQWRLGMCYRQGRGVPANFGKAVDWFEKSAAQGNLSAKGVLRELIGDAMEIAANGDVHAQRAISLCHRVGVLDEILTENWFQRTQQQQSQQSETKIKRRRRRTLATFGQVMKVCHWICKLKAKRLAKRKANSCQVYEWTRNNKGTMC